MISSPTLDWTEERVDRDAWIKQLDYEAFQKDVYQLGRKLQSEEGEEDVKHLGKIVNWRNIAAIVGVVTMGCTPNILTIAALSTWTYASWTMIAHHTCHGGYNRVEAGEFNSRGFALGIIQKRVYSHYTILYNTHTVYTI